MSVWVQVCGKLMDGQNLENKDQRSIRIWSSREKFKLKVKSVVSNKEQHMVLRETKRCHGTFGMSGVDSAAFMPSL